MVFEFSLQQVLEHKQHWVQQCEQNLAAVQQKIQKLQHILDHLKDDYLRERDERNAFCARSDFSNTMLLDRSLEHTKDKMIKILQEMNQCRQERDLLEATLIQAKRALKIIEKLKEKKEKIYNQKQSVYENKQLDNWGIQNFPSKRRA